MTKENYQKQLTPTRYTHKQIDFIEVSSCGGFYEVYLNAPLPEKQLFRISCTINFSREGISIS